MSYLDIRDLVVAYGGTRILHGVTFSVEPGERICLLGPSGCGKTTTLQVVAGFVRPESGLVQIDGNLMDDVPPEMRNIGLVFQNYALFPHLTVYDNVAFGLRMRKQSEDLVRKKVMDALELVRLPHAASKRPSMLSGGEQQRIAFARAVIIEPKLLLLDEPFSNLDARLRQEMRSELLELLQQLRIATVLVTHDQEEAMAIADKIVVMRSGYVDQIGTPAQIYERPRTAFVARFIGESVVLTGTASALDAGHVAVDVAGLGRVVAAQAGQDATLGAVQLIVRPERLHVRTAAVIPAAGPGINRVEALVERVMYLGHRTEYQLKVGDHRLLGWRLNQAEEPIQAGQMAVVEWSWDDTLVFPER